MIVNHHPEVHDGAESLWREQFSCDIKALLDAIEMIESVTPDDVATLAVEEPAEAVRICALLGQAHVHLRRLARDVSRSRLRVAK